MKNQRLLLIVLLALSLLGRDFAIGQNNSSSLSAVIAQQNARLTNALERLKQQRLGIQNTQLPLARKLRELEDQSKTLRRSLVDARGANDIGSLGLAELQNQVASDQEEYDYVADTLFAEFEASLTRSLSIGEMQGIGERIRNHNLALDNPSTPEAERLASSLQLLTEALDRIEQLSGSRVYPGEAILPNGKRAKGNFIQTGPGLQFAGQEQGNSGSVVETQSLQPKIITLSREHTLLIEAAIGNSSATLPLDASQGEALKVDVAKETIWVHLRKGGLWVVPILLFTLTATIVAIAKFYQLFSIQQPAPNAVHHLLHLLRENKREEAMAFAKTQPQPMSQMLRDGVEHADESIELVEEVMYEAILSEQPRLERYLNIIAVTAATAPLLGLLGTVTGIIKTFKLMEVFGAGDPKPLLSGISEALITTELGLLLAIPALMAHSMLARRAAGILARMEKLSIAFVNGLSRKSIPSSNQAERS